MGSTRSRHGLPRQHHKHPKATNALEGGVYPRVDRYRAWIAAIPGVVLA
jgi:hypothetical protein